MAKQRVREQGDIHSEVCPVWKDRCSVSVLKVSPGHLSAVACSLLLFVMDYLEACYDMAHLPLKARL
jgi:hypothetical protein